MNTTPEYKAFVEHILIIPDEQNPSTGRYLFRYVDSHPQHVPSFELRSEDVNWKCHSRSDPDRQSRSDPPG